MIGIEKHCQIDRYVCTLLIMHKQHNGDVKEPLHPHSVHAIYVNHSIFSLFSVIEHTCLRFLIDLEYICQIKSYDTNTQNEIEQNIYFYCLRIFFL